LDAAVEKIDSRNHDEQTFPYRNDFRFGRESNDSDERVSTMDHEIRNKFEHVCALAEIEEDPDKFAEISRDIVRILDENQVRLNPPAACGQSSLSDRTVQRGVKPLAPLLLTGNASTTSLEEGFRVEARFAWLKGGHSHMHLRTRTMIKMVSIARNCGRSTSFAVHSSRTGFPDSVRDRAAMPDDMFVRLAGLPGAQKVYRADHLEHKFLGH
jgi:hypothetical protein